MVRSEGATSPYWPTMANLTTVLGLSTEKSDSRRTAPEPRRRNTVWSLHPSLG